MPDCWRLILVLTLRGLRVRVGAPAEAVAEATGYRGEILWDTCKPEGTPRKQLDVSRLTSTVAEFWQQLSQQLVRL